MAFQCIKSDKRRRKIVKDWEDWLREADHFYCRYLDEIGTSPFDCHEIAAVGFLSASAARADFLTLAEYEVFKRSQKDLRYKVPGRADLWISRDDFSYSFEVKRAWYAATENNLKKSLNRARADINVVSKDECNIGAGVLICYVRDEARLGTYQNFSSYEYVDMAYRIGPDGEGGAYLFFSIKG